MPVKSFEPINPSTDITTTRTFLHEVLPLTGAILSGTYGTFPSDTNVKNYTHGMFQSVYDYAYLSSSANHIFDVTAGIANSSQLSGTTVTQMKKKTNMYNEFAQVLLGYTGSNNAVRVFENDLKLDQKGAMRNVFVISLSRLLVKDEIKKGTFKLKLGTGSWSDPFGTGSGVNTRVKTLQDSLAKVNGDGVNNADGGDYGVLYDKSNPGPNESGYGVIFYQAGIVVLSSSVWQGGVSGSKAPGATAQGQRAGFYKITRAGGSATKYNVRQCLQTASISGAMDALRHRIQNISFNNTTEINSTIYFCRAPTNKFNYSSNPTYVTGSKIRVKNVASDNPVAYVTTVGLYNSQNELMAVAKLSEPLKKSIDNELTIRVRLDY
jgi:hypothetical protein